MPTPPKIISVNIDNIVFPTDPDRFRPGDSSIDDLAASIHEHGLLQPIVITPNLTDDHYDLIAGQRRVLACRALGWTEIPAYLLTATAEVIPELRLAENVQRQDLSPLEEAVAIKRWREQANLTQEQAAERLGRGLSWLKKREALLSLQDDLMAAVHANIISPSIAVELKSIEDDQTRGYYIQTAKDYGCTQDVAAAWARNYKAAQTNQDPTTSKDTTSAWENPYQSHVLPCHVCQQTFPIGDLRTVFLCPADHVALAGATRPKPV